MAVDGDVGDIGEELGGAVLAAAKVEQRRRLVDEARGVPVLDEIGMRDDVFEEGEVGGNAADADSRRARCMRAIASSGPGAQQVIFSSSGS